MIGSRSCSSRGVELGNDNWLWLLVSGPVVCGLWVACHGKSELLAALLPCSATMTHGSVSCLCSAVSRGLVSFGGALFWHLVS